MTILVKASYSFLRLAGFGKINPQTGSISRSQIVSPREDESKVQVIRQDPYVDEVLLDRSIWLCSIIGLLPICTISIPDRSSKCHRPMLLWTLFQTSSAVSPPSTYPTPPLLPTSNLPWPSSSKRSSVSSWSSAMWWAAFSSSRTSPSAGSWPRSSAPICKRKAWKRSSQWVFGPHLRHSTRHFLQWQLSAPAVYLHRVARAVPSRRAASIRRPRCNASDCL